jgi:hypothetical protein
MILMRIAATGTDPSVRDWRAPVGWPSGWLFGAPTDAMQLTVDQRKTCSAVHLLLKVS